MDLPRRWVGEIGVGGGGPGGVSAPWLWALVGVEGEEGGEAEAASSSQESGGLGLVLVLREVGDRARLEREESRSLGLREVGLGAIFWGVLLGAGGGGG